VSYTLGKCNALRVAHCASCDSEVYWCSQCEEYVTEDHSSEKEEKK
jgi:hypothetical protein